MDAKISLLPQRILVSGSSGLVGGSLVPFLREKGHEVFRLVRDQQKQDPFSISWHPETGKVSVQDLEGFDHVIHLAGENIGAHRFTKEQKKRLFLSRTRDTWFLAQALLRLSSPPKTFISASACGFYGNRGEEKLVETSSPGHGFLADLCVKWEEASSSLSNRGVRRLFARFGHILSAKGGLLAKLLPIYRAGLGGKLGSGAQKMPWIALDDVLDALYHTLVHPELEGAVNISSPHPVTQAEFARTLSHEMKKPCLLHLPKFLLRLFLGEIADELLLASQNVYPEKLLKSNFCFRYPRLEDALKNIIT